MRTLLVGFILLVPWVAVETSFASAHDLRSTPRRAVQSYLDAMARGDARGICAALSAKARRTVVHEEGASNCPDAVSPVPRVLGHVKIVSADQTGATALVMVGDARYSDSGNDAIPARRVHGRWYLTEL
jgi:hypothetical protein